MSTKNKVLALLEANREKSISGVSMATQLNISRNAVWKAIKELQKDGHIIQAVTNKGYCLCRGNDILSVQGMLPFLENKNISNGITVYDCLASTNQTAKEMALSGANHGTIIIADCQTAGKGRYGRSFYSPSKSGIYMSFILRPESQRFVPLTLVTVLSALAVCEAVEDLTNKQPSIKWINDIYLDGKKICGILTEAVTGLESGCIEWLVVGVGINFDTPGSAFPEELRTIAGSIFMNEQPNITRNHLAAGIINRLLLSIDNYDRKDIISKYKDRLMILGKKITVLGAEGRYKAIATGLDDCARLIVKDETGKTHILSSGEVSIEK